MSEPNSALEAHSGDELLAELTENFLSRYRAYTTCAACDGGRLQPEALNFRVDGRTLPDWWRLPVGDLARIVRDQTVPDPTAAMLLGEIQSRLGYLERRARRQSQ